MRAERPTDTISERLSYLLLPLAALVAALPLFLHGCSCGHDIGFHLQSWLNAAEQLRHGTLYPAWATTPAFNAGEPRFVFYPPLSWMLGALLTMLVPFQAVPALYTWLALSAAGLSMYAVTRRLGIAPLAAFVASAIYLANPYMLFTAIERTAFAELLAAAWIPWLLLALLRERPTVPSVAWPLALLWLTNAPAAVMGSYTLALVATIRVVYAMRRREEPLKLATTYVAGAVLGLALPAFYLVPAIYEQRFVQITMALVPGLSVPANFLFIHTADAAHDVVNHQASRLAAALLLLTLAALALAWKHTERKLNLLTLAITTLLIAFLLEPLSLAVWMHLPELAFLQFPWRLLMVLAAIFALAFAFAIKQLPAKPRLLIPAAFVAVIALALPLTHFYAAGCAAGETPAATARNFHTSHGVLGTDEYTPKTADNDVLRFDNPGYWLTSDPAGFAPNTLPNPNAAEPDHDFGDPPLSETLSTPAPHHLELTTTTPQILVLNLRDYPNWDVTDTRADGPNPEHPAHLLRDDGLIAIALRPGKSVIDIRWQTGRDRYLGLGLSILAAMIFVFCIFRSRRIVL